MSAKNSIKTVIGLVLIVGITAICNNIRSAIFVERQFSETLDDLRRSAKKEHIILEPKIIQTTDRVVVFGPSVDDIQRMQALKEYQKMMKLIQLHPDVAEAFFIRLSEKQQLYGYMNYLCEAIPNWEKPPEANAKDRFLPSYFFEEARRQMKL